VSKKTHKRPDSTGWDSSAVEEDRTVAEAETAAKAGPDVDEEEAAAQAEGKEQEVAEKTAIPVAELEQLKTENEEYYDKLLRLKAEFENYKKRIQREFDSFRKYAAEDVVMELLPVLDNFERALSNVPEGVNDGFRQGVEIIHRQLVEALAKVGLSPMEAVGEKFDPNIHDAMTQVESAEHDEGTVVEEFLKGYRLFDKVIRHAKVAVSSGKGEENEENPRG
jgi:molecular chaperone GrpE